MIPNVASATEPVDGWVHSVESGGTVDGPGVRFVVFTTGCPLRCLYCHNPDSLHLKDGRQVSSAKVVAEIAGYAPFLKRARGGVTISGGEPLAQPAFTAALLSGCKRLGLHTALDTSGYLGAVASDALLADTDLVLLDIKSFEPETYRRVTGVPLQPTLDFARRLSDLGKPTWVRFVLVPGLTDDARNVAGLADFVATLRSVERVEILPFHKMGEFKWRALGRIYELENTPTPSPEHVEFVRSIFRARGLRAV